MKFTKKIFLQILALLVILTTSVTVFAQEDIQSEVQPEKKTIFPVNISIVENRNNLSDNNLYNDKEENINIEISLKDEFKTYSDYDILIIENGAQEPLYRGYHDKNDILNIKDVRFNIPYIIGAKIISNEVTREFGGYLYITQDSIILDADELKNEESKNEESKNEESKNEVFENEVSEEMVQKEQDKSISLQSCIDIIREHENNNNPSNAEVITPDICVMGKISYYNDVDCFKISTNSVQGIKVVLDVPSSVDYELQITECRSSGTVPVATGRNGTGKNEIIKFIAKPNNEYFIKVYGYNNNYDRYLCYNLYAYNENPFSCLNWRYFFDDKTINRITSNYGDRYYNGPDTHEGFDISESGITGTKIKSVTSGVVDRACLDPNKGTGYSVTVKTNTKNPYNIYERLYTTYMHMSKMPTLRRDNYVDEGDLIGYVGNTGDSSGAHLHFQVSIGELNYKYEKNVNPIWFFPQIIFDGDTTIDPHSYDCLPNGSFSYSNYDVNPKPESSIYDQDDEDESYYCFDLNLIDYVGEDKVMNWIDECKKNDPEKIFTINDFRLQFNITDTLFIELADKYDLNDFYDVPAIISAQSVK